MIEFLTSKTGVVAAVVVVLGIVGSVWKLWTDVKDRRAKQEEKRKAEALAAQGLVFADLRLSDLSQSANSYDLQFVLTNTGSNALIMRTLSLRVTGRSEIDETAPSYTMAPLEVHKHRVEFRPDVDAYDVRARAFGRGSEPLAFGPGEAEAFVVKLVSKENKRIKFFVEAEWYASTDPEKTGAVKTDLLTAAFPERVNAGPPGGA